MMSHDYGFNHHSDKHLKALRDAFIEADNMGLDDEQTIKYVIAKLEEACDDEITYKEINGKKYRLICNWSRNTFDFSTFPFKPIVKEIDAVRAAVEAHKEFDLILLNSQCTPKDYLGVIDEPGWSLFCGSGRIDLSSFWSTVDALEALQEST